MKKILFYLFLLLSSIGLQAQNQSLERHWKKNVEKIRVMSYNILNGFDWGKDKDRENRLVEWIKERDPEIIGLQELCGFNQEKLSALAVRWGHPYAVIVKEDGYPVGITSKRPIEVKAKLVGEIGHGMLHVKTYGYDVLVTHLNPHNAAKRNVEASMVVEYIQKNKLTNCMLMGDMNAHSPYDADYMETHSTALLRQYGGDQSKNLLGGMFDYSVISHYLSVPLIDVCRMYVEVDKRTTYPTPVLMEVSKQKQVHKRVSERLDYIFVTPNIMNDVVDAFIFNEGAPDYLSDHYPIAIDLCINRESQKL